MRLPKIALVAAACALTSLNAQNFTYLPQEILNGDNVTNIGDGGTLSVLVPLVTRPGIFENTVYNPVSSSGTVTFETAATLTLFSEYSTTINTRFVEGALATPSNLVKNGGGTLQFNAWRDSTLGPSPFIRINGQLPYLLGVTSPNLETVNGISGNLIVNQGVLRLAGYVNTWAENGPTQGVMTGVDGVILEGSSIIEFTNTPQNMPTIQTSVGSLRVNMLNNINAGIDGDQLQTEIIAGTTGEYRVILHTEAGRSSTVGILAGAGSFAKTGPGDLTIINDGRTNGAFYAAGGRVSLDTPRGLGLATASSVNLVGDVNESNSFNSEDNLSEAAKRGQNARYLEDVVLVNNVPVFTSFKPGYVPKLSASHLDLRNDQTIRNFQSNFALNASPDANLGSIAQAIKNAGSGINAGEPVIPGLGANSGIILNGNTLTIIQQAGRDGVYKGNFYGGSLPNIEEGKSGEILFTAGIDGLAVNTDEKSTKFNLLFDKLPQFGSYRLQIKTRDEKSRLSDSIVVGDADDLGIELASILNLSPGDVTVERISLPGSELAYEIGVKSELTEVSVGSLGMGRIVLDGEEGSKLVLLLAHNSSSEIEVKGGELISNAIALGRARVDLSNPESQISVYQNETGTIEASFVGQGTVTVVANADVYNGNTANNRMQVNSEGTTGELNFALQQRKFTGQLIVKDGVEVSLSAITGLVNSTLPNASAIILDSTGAATGSTLRFNDTDQLIRNLSGDARSRINLGRGTMTLDITAPQSYLGAIEGAGSVIKTGPLNFTLNGNGTTDFSGATVVQSGLLTMGSVDAVRRSSALILANSATVQSLGLNQVVGALFGESATEVNMGSATLTVGFTPGRYADLGLDMFQALEEVDFVFDDISPNIEFFPLSHNYLGTTNALEVAVLPSLEDIGPVGALLFNRTPLGLSVDTPPTESQFFDVIDPDTGWPVLGMVDQTRLYLEKVAPGTSIKLDFAGNISGSGSGQTIRYGSNSTDRDLLDSDGNYVNPSYRLVTARVSLNKTGFETVNLTGINTFTGAVVIRQGTLQVDWDAITTASAVYVLANSWSIDYEGDGVLDANINNDGPDNDTLDGYDLNRDGVLDEEDRIFDGKLAVNVELEEGSKLWSQNILGDGNFSKIGGGTLVIDGPYLQHTGKTTVEGGALELRMLENPTAIGTSTLGNVEVEDGTTLILRTDVALRYLNTISAIGLNGTGNLTKDGSGTLEIGGNNIQISGTISVAGGTLKLDTLPNLGGFAMLEIAAGAVFDITVAAATTQTLGSDIRGSGDFIKNGTGTLVLLQDTTPLPPAPGSGFTGSIFLNAGVTQVGLPGSLRNSTFDLSNTGTTLQLVNGAHEFAELVGESGTILDLINNGTTLTLNVPPNTTPEEEDDDKSFLGRFINSGNLTKTGAGTLRLAPTGGVNNIDTLRINGGKLIATLDGLGGVATIDVGAGGELEFESTVAWDDRTAPAPLSIIYTQNITGAGKVSKSGIGDILLSGAGLLPTGGVDVEAGTLIVDDRRFGGQIPAGVTVQPGATFELLLTANRTLTNQVSGSGNFAVSGEHLLTVDGNPLYTGKTILRSGADLGFVDPAPILGGLEADAADNVVSLAAGTRLTLNTIDPAGAKFAGSFLLGGVADLVIKGTSAFRYVNDVDGGNLGGYTDLNVTVDGGILQVGLSNTRPITLTSGGALQIFAGAGEVGAYSDDATITIDGGASQIIKVGEGTLDITGGLPSTVLLNGGVFQRLLVKGGNARVRVTESGIIGFSQLAISEEGALELAVDSGTGLIADAIIAAPSANGGFISKSGDGTLILKKGIATTARLEVAEGTVQLGQSASDGASLGGDVDVLAEGTLTGSGTIAGGLFIEGTLAPGYSPGTITVSGPHTFSSGSTFDVEVSGALSDRLVANGTFTIQPGATLKLAAWDDPATPGVVEGTSIGSRYTIVQAASTITGTWDNLTTVAPAASAPAAQTTAYLVAYPGQNLGRPGVIDVIVVRSTPAGSDNATTPLVTSPVGGISTDLVSRLSNLTRVEVDAAGNVSDQTSGDLGQRLAVLTPSEAPGALRSLTGMGYLSGIGMAHLSASSDAEEISRRLEQRRYDRGYMSVKPRQFFVTATSGKWDAGDELTSANYDIRRNGMVAGADWDVGMDAIVGWAIALDQSKASLDGGGSVESTHARVMGYASTMLMDDMAYAQAGVSLGHATMDATRSWFAFNVNSSPSAFTAAAWARAGTVASLGRGTVLSPFLQVDASHANQKGFKETGNADTALAVESLSQTAIRGRVGFSLAHFWDTDRGDWRYRVSVDVAHVLSLSGETMSVKATNSGELGSAGDITATANPLDEGGLVIAPAISLGPDNDTTYSLSAEIRQLDGGNATSINLTYRRRF